MGNELVAYSYTYLKWLQGWIIHRLQHSVSCRFCSTRTPFLLPYNFKASLLSVEAWKMLLNTPATVQVPSASFRFSSISTSVNSLLRFPERLNAEVLFSSSASRLFTSSRSLELRNLQHQAISFVHFLQAAYALPCFDQSESNYVIYTFIQCKSKVNRSLRSCWFLLSVVRFRFLLCSSSSS